MADEELTNDPGSALTTSIGSDTLDLAVAAGDAGLDALLNSGALDGVPIFGLVHGLYKVGRDIPGLLYQRKVLRMLSAVAAETTLNQREAFATSELERDAGEQLGETLLLLVEKADEVQKPSLIGRVMAAHIRGDIDRSTATRVCAMIIRAYYPDLELLKTFRYGTGAPKQSTYATLAAIGLLDNRGMDGGRWGTDDPMLSGGALLSVNEYSSALIRFGFLMDIDTAVEIDAAADLYNNVKLERMKG